MNPQKDLYIPTLEIPTAIAQTGMTMTPYSGFTSKMISPVQKRVNFDLEVIGNDEQKRRNEI